MHRPLVATVGVTLALFALSLLPIAAVASAAVTLAHPPATHSTGRYYIAAPKGKVANWPQIGFDSGHSANNTAEATLGVGNVGQLQQAWSFSTGSAVPGNAVYANGVLYVPSSTGVLYALNASTGEQLWTYQTGTGHQTSGSAAAVDAKKGWLFTVCNLTSQTQGICELDAMTGALIKAYTVKGSTSYAGTPPVVGGDGAVFYEGCTPTNCSYVSLHEKYLYAQWTLSNGSSDTMNGLVPPVANGLLYATFQVNQLYLCAWLLSNGSESWCKRAPPLLGLAVNSRVGMWTDTTLERFDPISGEGTGGARTYHYTGLPAIVKDYAIVQGGNGIAAVKPGADWGQIFWSNVGYSSASVANGVVYTACPGTPCALTLSSGYFLWGTLSGPGTSAIPIVVNGVLYGQCSGNNVCAWALPGSLRRRH